MHQKQHLKHMTKLLQLLLLCCCTQFLHAEQTDTLFNLNRVTSHFVKEDTIWTAARYGIVKRQISSEKILVTYSPDDIPFPYYNISDLCIDGKNRMWLFLDETGIAMLDGYDWQVYSDSPGNLPLYPSGKILDDELGNIWFIGSFDHTMRLKFETGRVEGALFLDENLDCSIDPSEPMTDGYRLVFDNGQNRIETVADPSGRFSVALPSGNYQAYVLGLNNYNHSCLSGFQVNVTKDHTTYLEIPVQTIARAPQMSIQMASPFARRCFETPYFVNVCNDGNLDAQGAAVSLQLPPALTFIRASVPSTIDPTGKLTFSLGNMDANTCRNFSFFVKIGCVGVVDLGQSICLTAHVFPDTIPTYNWNGASILLRGECVGSSVVFDVKNEGNTYTNAPLNYQVFKDQYRLEQGSVELLANETKQFSYPADGSTWRFSIEQATGHPVAPPASVAIEGCPTDGSVEGRSSGFVAQADNASGSAFETTYCQVVVGSFDPNDKRCQPIGWGEQHQIEPDQLLQYNIRFQNTGTDTAFTVVIRDTLDAALDWNSFEPGLSSHVYQVVRDSAQRSLDFVFENIMLPDSNRNELASHGFVQFAIRPRADVPLGTIVKNQASIYFDFNLPVHTNAVQHKIDTGFIIQLPVIPPNAITYINFLPNPAGAKTMMLIKPFDPTKTYEIEVFQADGRFVERALVDESPFHIVRKTSPNGVYQVVLYADKKRVAVGRLVLSR